MSCDSRSQQHSVTSLTRFLATVCSGQWYKVSLNAPKRFLLAAEEPCRWAALRKAATNWTLTTATSVRHALSAVIASVQRRTNQPDGAMPHLEVIHSLKREQGEGGDSRGRGQWLTSCPRASCSAACTCVCARPVISPRHTS